MLVGLNSLQKEIIKLFFKLVWFGASYCSLNRGSLVRRRWRAGLNAWVYTGLDSWVMILGCRDHTHNGRRTCCAYKTVLHSYAGHYKIGAEALAML